MSRVPDDAGQGDTPRVMPEGAPEGQGGRRFRADRGDARVRLDHAILRRLSDVPRLSRSRIQAWIGTGLVFVNGGPVLRPAARLAEGDVVDVRAPEALVRRERPRPEARPVEVLYEDEYLLAVNKPPGMVAHPSYKNTSGTLLNALLALVPAGTPDAPRPSLVQRLDKGTSGLLLVARSAQVHALAQRALAQPDARKEYLAVVAGIPHPRTGRIALSLARDPGDRRRVTVDPEGQESVTLYDVLDSSAALSLVRCQLVTGRTHQIRVHLSASGWPIAGDVTYGGPPLLPRPALHAWRLRVCHPMTGVALEVMAPIPSDFLGLLNEEGLAAPADD